MTVNGTGEVIKYIHLNSIADNIKVGEFYRIPHMENHSIAPEDFFGDDCPATKNINRGNDLDPDIRKPGKPTWKPVLSGNYHFEP